MRKGDSEIVANVTHKGICTDEKEDSEIVVNATRKAICIDKKGDSKIVVNACNRPRVLTCQCALVSL